METTHIHNVKIEVIIDAYSISNSHPTPAVRPAAVNIDSVNMSKITNWHILSNISCRNQEKRKKTTVQFLVYFR